METICMRHGHPLWEKTIAFARGSSWRAGPVLADRMERNGFQAWERVIAAAEDGNIVGYCTFTEQDELPAECGFSPFIGFVFVEEPHRGNRISQSMIDEALRYAGSIGYETVYLMSGEQGLYEKYGFTKLREYDTVYGTRDQLFCRSTADPG
ncbi:MAG: GNAT family N-acetyltransferase [Oscillospiraceae bacterium]|nr:GNAT family N-acetyltransferase [Oscillospiraceae bacterium]